MIDSADSSPLLLVPTKSLSPVSGMVNLPVVPAAKEPSM